MSARHRSSAAAAAFAAATLTGMLNAPPASAFLAIDWFSCRPEVVSNGEGGIRRTGRQICSLTGLPGIIFRQEPRDPEDRACAGDIRSQWM